VSLVFVIQEHRPRCDLWLEHDGVFASWAIPKGLPGDPAANHLAVRTEDRRQYGASTMRIADSGTYDCSTWTDREVKITLHGSRYSGAYALFQTDGDQWMIHRERVPAPRGLLPMLAGGTGMPASDEGWGYEMKWDGQRALAYVEDGRVRLIGRSGRDITESYPELAALGPVLPRRGAVLDGEIVAFEKGSPSFAALQPRMHATGDAAKRLVAATPITYLVFDVLHLDGRPLLDVRYEDRQQLLADLELAGPAWHTPPAFLDVSGKAVLHAAEQQGLEGIVAKRLDSGYLPGVRSPDWRKVKRLFQQEVVVGGWRPGKGVREGRIGSLLVGVGTSAGLAYAGRVGTGFDEAMLRLLGERLAPLARETSPFDTEVPADHVRDARWVEPELVVQVSFDRWTRDDRLRHPVFLGLRTDIDPRQVVREP